MGNEHQIDALYTKQFDAPFYRLRPLDFPENLKELASKEIENLQLFPTDLERANIITFLFGYRGNTIYRCITNEIERQHELVYICGEQISYSISSYVPITAPMFKYEKKKPRPYTALECYMARHVEKNTEDSETNKKIIQLIKYGGDVIL